MRFQKFPISTVYSCDNELVSISTKVQVGESVKKGDLLYYNTSLKKYMKALASDSNKMPATVVVARDLEIEKENTTTVYLKYDENMIKRANTRITSGDIVTIQNNQIVTSSSYFDSNYYAWKAFNNNNSDTYSCWYAGQAYWAKTAYLWIKLPESRIFKSMKIHSPTNSGYANYSPISFKIKGRKSPNTQFIKIFEYNTDDKIWPTNTTREFIFDNPDNLSFDEIWIYDISMISVGQIYFYDENDQDILPAWTNGTTPEGYEYEGYPYYNTSDNLPWTVLVKNNDYAYGWHVPGGISLEYSSPNYEPFIEIEFIDRYVIPKSYEIAPRYNHLAETFSKWRLWGSVDGGVNWELLDDVSEAQNWTTNASKLYAIDNPENKSYNKFRLRSYSAKEDASVINFRSIGYINIFELEYEDIEFIIEDNTEEDTDEIIEEAINIPFTKGNSEWSEQHNQIVTSSSYYDSNLCVWKSFNNNNSDAYSCWVAGQAYWTKTAYLWIKLPESRIFKSMKIHSPTNSGYANRSPISFKIKGRKSPNTQFIKIFEYNTGDKTWPANTTREFIFDNPDNLSFDEIWIYDISMISVGQIYFYDENDQDILPAWTNGTTPEGYEYEGYPYYNSSDNLPWTVLVKNNDYAYGWHVPGGVSLEYDSPDYEPFIEIEFIDRYVIPKSYEIAPRYSYPAQTFSKWRLWGSVDGGVNWELLDDVSVLQNWTTNASKSYDINNPEDKSYNKFRLRSYSVKEGGTKDHLAIGYLNIFGTIDRVIPLIIEDSFIKSMYDYIYSEKFNTYYLQRVVASSEYDGNYRAWKAFNKLSSSYYDGWYAAGGSYNIGSAYCEITIPEPKIIKKIEMYPYYASHAPILFRVKGRLSGTDNWVKLFDQYPDDYYTNPLSDIESSKITDWTNAPKSFDINPDNLLIDAISLYDINMTSINSILFYDENEEDVLPIWTSNTAPDGYSHYFYPEYQHPTWLGWICLSKNKSTSVTGWHMPASASSYPESSISEYAPFIDISFSKTIIPIDYSIAKVNYDHPIFNKWRMYGSSDYGVNWELIDDVSEDQILTNNETRKYLLNNVDKKEYNRFRLRRYSTSEGGAGHAIGEWDIFDYKEVLVNYNPDAGLIPILTVGNAISAPSNVHYDSWDFHFIQDTNVIFRAQASTTSPILNMFNESGLGYSSGGQAFWIESPYTWVKLPFPRIFKRLELYSITTDNTAPRSFKVKGKLENGSFVKLYDYIDNDQIWPGDTKREFILNNPNNLKFIEIHIYDISFQALKSIIFYDENDQDILPIWTSDTPPVGYDYDVYPHHVTSNKYDRFRVYSKIIENKEEGWHALSGQYESDLSNYKPFVDMFFPKFITPTSYHFSPTPNINPIQNWKLWGSSDNGVNWDLLDDVDFTWTSTSSLLERDINSENNSYNRFRIQRYDKREGGVGLGFGSFQFYSDSNEDEKKEYPIDLYVSENTPGLAISELPSDNSIVQKVASGKIVEYSGNTNYLLNYDFIKKP